MANSMVHWNGQQVCAIDIETTGVNPLWHEIVELAILPLDSNFMPRKDVAPLDIYIIPDHKERWDEKAKETIKRNDLVKIINTGLDSEAAKDVLENWLESLGLPYTGRGLRKFIIPLGHNYAFDRGFIEQWLGPEMYNEYFDSRYRDTMTASLYMNDRAGVWAEKVPYPKNNLSYLAKKLGIDTFGAHNALVDCRITAQVYAKLCNVRGVMG